ncbi:MAG TPA: hypothetical protein VJ179_04175 [Patescibacteria group bacterium]|nr:hypothetical protein [Patescibacteria group bacterium]
MKKNKIVLLVVFLLVIIGLVVVIAKGRTKNEPQVPQEKKKSEIPLDKRPYLSLTPSSDGHTLTLGVLFPEGVSSFDYKLFYLTDGIQQGWSNTVVKPKTGERLVLEDLLLGTCSKMVCKYDKNVEEGEITIEMEYEKEFGEFSTRFRLYQPKTDLLSSADGNFLFRPKTRTSGYTVVTETIGLPAAVSGTPLANPIGIFSSEKKEQDGFLTYLISGLSPSSSLLARRSETWEKVTASVKNEVIEATTSASPTFVIVK